MTGAEGYPDLPPAYHLDEFDPDALVRLREGGTSIARLKTPKERPERP